MTASQTSANASSERIRGIPDTDGDGVRDGVDPDPLHAPPGGGGGGDTPPPPSDCPAGASSGPATGPASGFEGLQNVIQEGRSLISHSTYPSAPVGAYCLYRKRRAESDGAYQLVGRDTGPEAGVIQDNQRPFKAEDYVYRTDAVTAAGAVAGSNTVAARGAGSIANVDGWAQIDQSCTSCGSASVQTGSLKAATAGAGGSRAARRGGRRLPPPARAGGRAWGRVGDPRAHAPDSIRARQLRQREPHDLRRAPGHRPWGVVRGGRDGLRAAVHQRRAARPSERQAAPGRDRQRTGA